MKYLIVNFDDDEIFYELSDIYKIFSDYAQNIYSETDLTENNIKPLEIQGVTYTDKTEAGTALLDACQDISETEPVTIGSYRGFNLSVKFASFGYKLSIKGTVTYKVDLGEDARGNITRIDNALAKIPESLGNWQAKLANLLQQQEAAKAEAGKPFPQEEELCQKSARLAALDAELNIGSPHPQTAA